MTSRILVGDARAMLRTLESNSVQTCVTSPPYFGLRAYGTNAQVWGGDPEHEHSWESFDRPRMTGGNGPVSAKQVSNTGSQLEREPWHQSSCVCGAWRGELGSEPTPDQFIANLVEVFQDVKRVLHPTGTLWLNLGDSYAGSGKGPTGHNGIGDHAERQGFSGQENSRRNTRVPQKVEGHEVPFRTGGAYVAQPKYAVPGYKAKDLMLMPFRVALALQADGWWLRSAITWCKAAPMPESVQDRPTSATEMVFLLSKQAKYFYDADAIREPALYGRRSAFRSTQYENNRSYSNGADRVDTVTVGGADPSTGRNSWNYWILPPAAFADAHFATFPPEIPRRAILAGTSERGVCPACGAPWRRVVERSGKNVANEEGIAAMLAKGVPRTTANLYVTKERGTSQSVGWEPTCRHDAEPVPATVLDPFLGSGTTLMVADRLQRHGIGIELNPQYALMAQYRIEQDAPMFTDVAAS